MLLGCFCHEGGPGRGVVFRGASCMTTLDAMTSVTLQRILLATDFGAVANKALGYTLPIARRYGAQVYLVHVLRPEPFQRLSPEVRQRAVDDAWRDAHRHMTDMLIAGRLEGIQHQVMVEQGEIWEVLSQKVEQLKIDLLVVGTHGRTRLSKLLLGSVAETIFRQAACPVLMVGPKAGRPGEGEGAGRILFCTGFSAHSIKAGSHALSLAQHQNGTLILMHVHTQEVSSESERARIREEARQRLEALIPADAQLSKAPEFVVEFGAAPERILAVAAEQKAGLIVLGVRQPAGFARRLKWATAYEVVSRARCPVLTVRMSEPA